MALSELSAHEVHEGREGGFASFAHGNHYLLVGDIRDIAGCIDTLDGCAATAVDLNLATSVDCKLVLEECAVWLLADLYENTRYGIDRLLAGRKVLDLDAGNARAVAHDFFYLR